MHRTCIHIHKNITYSKRKKKSSSKSGYPIYNQERINYRARKTHDAPLGARRVTCGTSRGVVRRDVDRLLVHVS